MTDAQVNQVCTGASAHSPAAPLQCMKIAADYNLGAPLSVGQSAQLCAGVQKATSTVQCMADLSRSNVDGTLDEKINACALVGPVSDNDVDNIMRVDDFIKIGDTLTLEQKKQLFTRLPLGSDHKEHIILDCYPKADHWAGKKQTFQERIDFCKSWL